MKKKDQEKKPQLDLARIGRWLLGVALFGGLLGGLVWSTAWIMAPDNVPLKQVKIEGDIRHTGAKTVKRAIAPHLRGSFFSLDLNQVRTAVEQLPWVSRASVRRIWPRSLVVTVHERTALAYWGSESVISPEGEIFKPKANSVPSGLVRFDGPMDGALQMVERYQWMRPLFAQKNLHIVSLGLSERQAWRMTLNNGTELQLGNRNLEGRVQRYLTHFFRLTDEQRATRVDLRYSGGFAVHWLEPPVDGGQTNGAEG